MTNENKIAACLAKQLEIVEKVMANLKNQDQFLHTPHMKGLNRMVREQGILIEEYIANRNKLNESTDWKNQNELKQLSQSIDEQYKTMVEICHRMVQEAVAKRKGIASEISRTKQQRHMKSKYVRQWQIASVGHRFSVKG